MCYLNSVYIGQGDRNTDAELRKEQAVSIQMNRILDSFVSFAIVALGLALAGATAIVGA